MKAKKTLEKAQVNKRAQTSIEFLVILGIALLVIVIGITISQNQQSAVVNQKDTSDVRNALYDLSSAAKEVYAQGEGSKKRVYVTLPSSYEPQYSFVANKSIKIRNAGSDQAITENFNLRGYLPGTPGSHWVWVVSEGTRVRIGDAMMDLDKNRIYLIMNANSSEMTDFTVTNIWTKSINITTTTTWNNPAVSMSSITSAFGLLVNESNQIDITFSANENASGTYYGEIELSADDGNGTTEVADVPIVVQVIPVGSSQTLDEDGPLIVSIYQEPAPAIKNQPLVIFVNASDALTGNHSIASCLIDKDNQNNWTNMIPVDGIYDSPIELSEYNYTNGFNLGGHTISAKCTDTLNNTGPTAYYYFNVSEADMLGPIVISMDHTDYPTTLTNITVNATTTEVYTGGSNIAGCNVKLDSGFWQAANADDGVYDSVEENISYNLGVLSVGQHTVYYQCTDEIGNVGGVYNDTFGIIDVDLMLVLDRSGSMAENITDFEDTTTVSAASTGWSWVKNLSVTQKNGDLANLTTELRASASGCMVSFNATINGVTIATGNRTSTSYGTITTEINLSGIEEPYDIALWLKRNATSCTAYNKGLGLQQKPTKLEATQASAKSFVQIAGNAIQAGLTYFSSSATLSEQLALMGSANQTTLENAIDALTASGGTCIECGLTNAADELTSVRARSGANKVIILLTDGISTSGDSVDGAVYCRDRNVTVYTIGLGTGIDEVELTNIALLTNGDYYFAPNAETLQNIFESIGRN